jgi:hypothetical protein
MTAFAVAAFAEPAMVLLQLHRKCGELWKL